MQQPEKNVVADNKTKCAAGKYAGGTFVFQMKKKIK